MRKAARIVEMALAPIAGANGGELLLAPSAQAVPRLVTVASPTSVQKTASATVPPARAPLSSGHRRAHRFPIRGGAGKTFANDSSLAVHSASRSRRRTTSTGPTVSAPRPRRSSRPGPRPATVRPPAYVWGRPNRGATSASGFLLSPRDPGDMNQRARRTLTVVRAIVHEIRTERITFMAGSIAYHAFVSLLPLLLLVLAVVAAIDQPGIEQGILDLARATLTPGAADILVGELRSTSPGVSVLGLLVLVWGTLRIFRGLDTAFSDIYESEARNTLVDQFRDGLLVFVCVAAAIVVAALLEQLLPLGGTAGWIAGRGVLVVGLGLAFLPMYYVFPDQPGMPVREVLPGVAFAAVGLTVFESAFRLYVEFGSETASGDVLAGILVFLTWLYFSGLVILVGVAINAVLSNRSRDVNIRPVIAGVPREGRRTGDGTDRPAVDRDELVAAVERLRNDLASAETVTVTVDGDPIEVPPPEQVSVDLDTSVLPFVSDSVSIELRWSPEGGAGREGRPPRE